MSDYFYIDLDALQEHFSQELVNPSFDKEDALNLEADDVGSLESERRIEAFRNRFYFNGVKNTLQNIELPQTIINSLYSQVSGKPLNKKCITALHVHFAVKIIGGQPKLILLFQPVFLTRNDYDAKSLTYEYRISFRDSIYYVNNGILTNCDAEAEDWQSNYKSSIVAIQRNKDILINQTSFIPAIDIESHLFPFQLIYTLLKDNRTDKINFVNCMVENLNSVPYYYKHSLMMFATPQVGGSGGFYGKYANRSHLCPPCTDEFGFLLDLENI